MRHSQRGDQLAEAIAFVIARALWLDHQGQQRGPHRARDREVASLRQLLDHLGATSCRDSIDEAYQLAQDHHEYAVRNREAFRRLEDQR